MRGNDLIKLLEECLAADEPGYNVLGADLAYRIKQAIKQCQ